MPESLDEAMFAIRPARPSDAAFLAQMDTVLGYPSEEAQVIERMARLDPRRDVVLVATIGDKVVGTASFSLVIQLHRDAPVAMIATLVVAESARRRGIGERLLFALETEAMALGSDRAELASRITRTDAHRLYERLGYEETSHRTHRYIRALEPRSPG